MNTSDAFAVIDHAPRSDDQDLLDRLSDDLRAAGYGHDAVIGLLGDAAHDALGRDQLVPALLVIQGLLEHGDGGPLVGVVGLWLLGMSFDAGRLDASFPRTGHAGLVRLGLIEPAAGQFRAAVDVRPHASDVNAEIWVASDLGAHQRPGVLRHDHVLGIGNASVTLAQAVIRRPAEHALDLGTGCGIQVFHLLSHCRRIVATDISARALAFTRFNLLLNHQALGLDPLRLEDRVQLRLGSLLEPVAGEQFDLVVSNPPFVITPRHAGERAEEQFTYRDGGMPADSLVESLVRGLPGVLAPGGTAQLLANWEIRDPDDDHGAGAKGMVDNSPDDKSAAPWGRRPKSWIAPGHDAWLILREQTAPELYAETWLRDASQGRDRDAYAAAYRDYLADFSSRDVSGVGFGLLWLRRPARSGDPTFGTRFEEIAHPIEQPIARYLAAQITATDSLAGQRAADLVLTVADDVTEERHQRPGAPHPGVILLRQGAGLRRTTLLSSAEAGFVSACDGEYSAGVLAQAVASLVDGDPDEIAANLLASVGRLVTEGFLTEMRNKG
ncbi:MAG TPA: methyltransferase [Arthrobacter sp.]|nr:methyltransferase [Arthrobacter sp.]